MSQPGNCSVLLLCVVDGGELSQGQMQVVRRYSIARTVKSGLATR